MVTNADVAAFLRELAAVLEAKGDSIFKIRAYNEAARQFETMAEDVTTLVADGRLRAMPGIGDAIATKVTELVTTGQSSYRQRYWAGLPPGLAELMRFPGLSPALAGRIYRAVDAHSLEDVVRAAREHRIAGLARIPAGTEEAILAGLDG